VFPEARENQVSYARPAGLIERYVMDDRAWSSCSCWRSHWRDLEVVGQFETALTPALVDPLKGVRFLDGDVDVLRYSGALVYDAAGRETSAPLRLTGNG